MAEVTLAALALGAWVFAASAGSKLHGRSAYRAFAAGLRETGLAPERALPAAAALLAGAEAVIAASLAVLAVVTGVAGEPGVLPAAQAALGCAAALTTVLAAGIVATVRSGAQARCACFGAKTGRPLGRVHLARNACLLAGLAAGLATGPLAHGHLAPPAAVLAAGTGSVAALVIIRWEDLADLFAPVPAATAMPRHRATPAGAAPRHPVSPAPRHPGIPRAAGPVPEPPAAGAREPIATGHPARRAAG